MGIMYVMVEKSVIGWVGSVGGVWGGVGKSRAKVKNNTV